MGNLRLFLCLTLLMSVSGALSASGPENMRSAAGAAFLNRDYRAVNIPMPVPPARADSGSVSVSGSGLQTAAFDVLANLFAGGVMPDIRYIAGWYAGRAFADVSPNTPEGTLFAGVYAETLPGGGPLFERQLRFAVFGNWESVDKYERLTYQEVNMMKGLIAEECFKLSVPQSNGRELTVSRIRADGFTELYQLRTNGNYLILKHTWTKKEGEVAVKRVKYAYYFRNITPYY